MDNALDTMSDLAAIGSMGQGFSALFGLDSSAIDESIQKLLALQNVLQSLEALNQHILTVKALVVGLPKVMLPLINLSISYLACRLHQGRLQNLC